MSKTPGFLRLLQYPGSDIRDDTAEDGKKRSVRQPDHIRVIWWNLLWLQNELNASSLWKHPTGVSTLLVGARLKCGSE